MRSSSGFHSYFPRLNYNNILIVLTFSWICFSVSFLSSIQINFCLSVVHTLFYNRVLHPLTLYPGLPATHLPWLDPPLRKAGSSPVSFTAQSPGHRTVSHTQQALNKYSLNEEAVREWPQLSRLNNPVFLLIWNSTFDSLLYFFCHYWSI